MSERKFAQLYQQIVNEPDDIVGLIAYGVYKQKKVEHIKKFCEERGYGPGDEDLEPFHSACLVHVDSYRLAAEQILQDAIQSITEEYVSEVDHTYHKKLLVKLSNSFFSNVLAGIVSAILAAGLIGLIVVGLTGFSVEYKIKGPVLGTNATQPAIIQVVPTNPEP